MCWSRYYSKNEESDFNELLDLLDLDVNSVELNWFTNIFKKVGNFFKGLWGKIKKGIEWLKKKGIWSTLMTIAKTAGRIAACKPLVNTVFST